MRDPFAGYDNWLVRPYEDAAEAALREEAYEEWEWENSTFHCDCCGEQVEYSSTLITCPHCGETEVKVIQEKPTPRDDFEEPDYDYYIED